MEGTRKLVEKSSEEIEEIARYASEDIAHAIISLNDMGYKAKMPKEIEIDGMIFDLVKESNKYVLRGKVK